MLQRGLSIMNDCVCVSVWDREGERERGRVSERGSTAHVKRDRVKIDGEIKRERESDAQYMWMQHTEATRERWQTSGKDTLNQQNLPAQASQAVDAAGKRRSTYLAVSASGSWCPCRTDQMAPEKPWHPVAEPRRALRSLEQITDAVRAAPLSFSRAFPAPPASAQTHTSVSLSVSLTLSLSLSHSLSLPLSLLLHTDQRNLICSHRGLPIRAQFSCCVWHISHPIEAPLSVWIHCKAKVGDVFQCLSCSCQTILSNAIKLQRSH